MRQALDPALLATDLADYLVQRGMPFRQAHGVIGQVVNRAHALDLRLDQLPLSELQAITPVFSADVTQVFNFSASANRRAVPGGTALEAVKAQLLQAETSL
jgi:argininosuccinate lyase